MLTSQRVFSHNSVPLSCLPAGANSRWQGWLMSVRACLPSVAAATDDVCQTSADDRTSMSYIVRLQSPLTLPCQRFFTYYLPYLKRRQAAAGSCKASQSSEMQSPAILEVGLLEHQRKSSATEQIWPSYISSMTARSRRCFRRSFVF